MNNLSDLLRRWTTLDDPPTQPSDRRLDSQPAARKPSAGPVEMVVCLVDRSGSMNCDDFPPSRLRAACEAVKAMMDAKRAIDPRDKVAVVAFNTSAQRVAEFSEHRFTALERTEQLTPTGSTNIHSGLVLSLESLTAEGKHIPHTQRRIALLSDGGHNTGPHPTEILGRIKAAGAIVDTVAIGTPGKSEYDEELLRRLAAETGGEFAIISNVADLIEKYRRLAQKKRTTIGQPVVAGIRRLR